MPKLTVVTSNTKPQARRRPTRKAKPPRPPIEDVFQRLILREVFLADGLEGDLQLAELAPALGRLLAVPASEAIAALVKGPTGAVAQKVTKVAIIGMFSGDTGIVIVRTARKLWKQLTGTDEEIAHSCCRTALCYAVGGNYSKAEEWLADAEKKVDDLARPNFIRG